ncbi:hypothetical protein [Pedobacter panaciterrae]
MDFEIRTLRLKDGENERLVLMALRDANIGEYIVMDSTYDDKNKLSNIFRHTFWFPDQMVKKGEIVVLKTRPGKNDYKYEPVGDGRKIAAHFFFWGSDSDVWNNEGDTVTFIRIAEVITKKFKEIQE